MVELIPKSIVSAYLAYFPVTNHYAERFETVPNKIAVSYHKHPVLTEKQKFFSFDSWAETFFNKYFFY